jgi:hypothetical protein
LLFVQFLDANIAVANKLVVKSPPRASRYYGGVKDPHQPEA